MNEIEYEFHKWKKHLLIADKLITLLAIFLLGIFRPDYVVMAAYFLAIPYLLLTERKILFYHFLVSSLIAIGWMLITKKEYGYNYDFITVAGINLYPLFAWAAGMFAIYIIYSHYEHILKEQGFIRKMLLFVAFYWPWLIFVETTAYHIFDIRNLTTASYIGLPLCDCIHAPIWMQISYFLLGPAFFAICYLLRLENPHFSVKRSYELQK